MGAADWVGLDAGGNPVVAHKMHQDRAMANRLCRLPVGTRVDFGGPGQRLVQPIGVATVYSLHPLMKSGLFPLYGRLGAALFLAVTWPHSGRSQTPVDFPDAGPPPQYTVEQLDQLLGPIALYPDPLVALILPAAASPGDIVSAASFVAAKADPYEAGSQPWSESVKALVHYPDVVEWMAQNLTWVQAVGTAFAADPADVKIG